MSGGGQVGRGIQPAQPDELLTDDGRLEVTLGGHVDVLEVSPAAEARPGVGARGLDAIG